MQITISTNGTKAWVARIIGDSAEFGYQREFMPRIRNAERGTGFARFSLPDDVNDSYEICYGDPESRQFVEIHPPLAGADGFYFISEIPGQEYVPEQDTRSLRGPLMPPAANPSRTKYKALMKSREGALTEDEFDGW